ncbi:hypothetical protein NBRC116494_13600 [Aurantivibrio plasticivorans]
MKEGYPLVTIYIPTKNRHKCLANAINSCLTQSEKNIEIIVVNDGSTDSTPELLQHYSNSFDNIHHVNMKQSLGAPACRNVAIKMAKGKFVTGLDDDDIFEEFRVRDFLSIYNSKWSFLCSTASEWQPETGEVINTHPSNKTISFNEIKRRNLVGNQIFIETQRIQAVGGFDETLQAWQDYDLWFRLIERYGPAFKIGNSSMRIRTSGERISSSPKAKIGYQQFIAKHKIKLSKEELLSQSINDLTNRRVKLSLYKSLIVGFQTKNTTRMLLLYLRTNFNWLYTTAVKFAIKAPKIKN